MHIYIYIYIIIYSTVQDCESYIDRVLNTVVEQRIIISQTRIISFEF